MKSVVPRVVTAALVSSVLLTGVVPAASAAEPASRKANQPAVQPGAETEDRYVVRYAPGTDVSAAARGLRGKGITVDREFSKAVRAAVVNLTPAEAAALAGSPAVEAVEVDALMSIDATQYSAPWGSTASIRRHCPSPARSPVPRPAPG